MLCFVAFCACGRSQGGGASPTSAPSKGSGGSTTSSATPNNTPTTAPSTAKPTATPEPTPEIEVDWQYSSFILKDSDGYRYKITMQFSPWILLSANSDILSSAWNAVADGHKLPSYEDWSVDDSFSYGMIAGKEYRYGQSGYFASSRYNMNDMYYCVGSFQIKNITDGWDITSDQPRSISVPVSCGSYDGNGHSKSGYVGLTASRVFYSNSTETYVGGLLFSPKLKSNNWGPVPFVAITSELFSPNTPDGGYFDYVLEDCSFAIKNRDVYDESGNELSDHLYYELVHPGIIDKDGVYTLPEK